ncbi:MAG: hypothetical protein P8105_07835 [Dehalococcoidia bacterium]
MSTSQNSSGRARVALTGISSIIAGCNQEIRSSYLSVLDLADGKFQHRKPINRQNILLSI